MKQHQFSFVQALIVAVGVLFFSSCNGEKIDSDLIDSITGKVSVEKITIDQEDFEMTEGESTVLTATVLPDDATDKTISWNSSKEDVVMISNTGKAMAMAPGKSVITAKAGSKTDFITITVIANSVPVTGISLDKTILELKVGDSETLTATVTPDNATNKNVSWTSSNATIATVENGRVTGVKPGSVTITAKTEDGGMTAECTVTVKTNLAPSITLGSENISAVSVVLKGEANLDAQMSSDMTMGIMWSENSGVLPSNSTKIEAKNIDAKEGSTTSYCYSVNLTGLDPDKTYYFRSYVTQNSQDTYGETKSFTTKELSSLLETKDASDITPTSAKMNAKLDLTDVQRATLEYGFYWSTSEDSQTTYVKGGEIVDNAYFALLNDLSHKTQYWYKAYLKVDDQEFYGAVKAFTTDVVPVESVSLDKTTCTVHTIDSTFTMTPTISPEDATNKSVSWESSNPSVATVDANGKVTAKGNGATVITITTNDQSKTATCEITVAQWVTGIKLDKITLTLNEGQAITLTPTISPSNAKDKSVTWSSSNTAVATVDQNGKVTAVEKGTATIKATANDGSGKSASCSLTVNRLVTSITMDKTQYTFLAIDGTLTLAPTVLPTDATDKSVSWKSSNTSVATVDANGKVTAKGNGTATITATAKDGSGKSATCTITVAQRVTGITLDKTSLTLNEGQTATLSPTVSPSNANDKSLAWSSSNTSVATVDQNGKVTALSKGTATIKATAKDGSGKSASCSVTVNRLVSSITLDKSSMTLYNGETATIAATVLPETANNREMAWASSNTSVATVSTSGVVTGVAGGFATITATAKDGSGKFATCKVEIKQYVLDIKLDKTSLMFNVGQAVTLSPTISPSYANDKSVAWSSDNTAVATVDQNGQVTAVSIGRASITVAAKDGSDISASCGVYVSPVGTVDMGFPMEGGKIVYWATSNLSEIGLCAKPEDYGDYYAWGETESYYAEGHSQDKPCSSWRSRTNPAITGYNWSSYKWCNGSSNTLTKYNTDSRYGSTVDNKTVLEPEDDVAHVKLGGSWRMPTDAEWRELSNNCTWTWSILHTVKGRLVTSTKNGASIFLPAAGHRNGTNLDEVGSRGYYWSSSLYTGYPFGARNVYFKSDALLIDYYYRCRGYSIRPVSE